MNKILRPIAVAVVALPGCSGGPPVDPAAVRASLAAAAESYHAAATAKSVDDVVGFYASDAIMMPPNAPLVEGIEGVRGYRFGFIETPGVSLDFELIRVEVSNSGDMGWTFAQGDITIERSDGPPATDVVRDFHTWRRQDDGSWEVVVDMWNSGTPRPD